MRVIFNWPEARSQSLIVLSAEPVQNHSFPGSNAIVLTQPRCPAMTYLSFQGACQVGFACFWLKMVGRRVARLYIQMGQSKSSLSLGSGKIECACALATVLDNTAGRGRSHTAVARERKVSYDVRDTAAWQTTLRELHCAYYCSGCQTLEQHKPCSSGTSSILAFLAGGSPLRLPFCPGGGRSFTCLYSPTILAAI